MIDKIKQVTSFWDRQPCNINHSQSKHGTLQWSREISDRKYFVEPHIKRFASFHDWTGLNVLEVGCGIGTDAISFKRAAANYIGIDISGRSVDIANLRLELEGIGASCHTWNIENPLNGETRFDLIYSFGVLHHTPNPKDAIRNIYNHTHQNSEFRLMLYAKNSWKNIMIEAGLDQFEAQSGCPVAFLFDEQEVRNLLNPYFQVVRLEQTFIFPYNVEKYKNYVYEVEPWFASMEPEMFRALQGRLGWHLLITAIPK